jgi:parallel beta-helix repeat protein
VGRVDDLVKGNGEVGNGLVFVGSSDLRINNNVAEGAVGQCFGLYEGTHAATLTGNTATGCRSAGFDVGGASGNTLIGNKSEANVGGAGFALGPNATSNVLSGNTSTHNAIGFQLWSDAGAPSHNALTRNVANTNAAYGFLVQAASSDNSFVRNAAHANGDLDAFQADDAGPGNVWFGNHFGTHAGF